MRMSRYGMLAPFAIAWVKLGYLKPFFGNTTVLIRLHRKTIVMIARSMEFLSLMVSESVLEAIWTLSSTSLPTIELCGLTSTFRLCWGLLKRRSRPLLLDV